jgi:putative membrane protein
MVLFVRASSAQTTPYLVFLGRSFVKKFFIDLAINAAGFFVAITVLSGRGITPVGENIWANVIVLALIFAAVNAFLRPIFKLLGCPFIVLTLGLGMLLINMLLFALTGWIGTRFGFGFTVDGLIPAFLGAVILSAVGLVLHRVMPEKKKKR